MRSALLLAALLAAGCLQAPAAEPSSGIVGVAMMGPTCPVERDPPDPACADRPYEGALVVLAGERVVASFATDAEGRFNVSVEPGEYTIARPPDASPLPWCQSMAIVVAPGRWTSADVACDTGIR